MSTMTADRTRILKAALPILKRLKAQDAAYDAEVQAWYTSGEGRTKGYRFPECRHGMSLWTDYDNICGACEEGASLYSIALSLAWNEVREQDERIRVALPLIGNGTVPQDIRTRLSEWVLTGE